ncbi:hypothetical protein OHT57_44450 [Streptomyces sp. NBC_00285]|uniref:hypothetical protein n=1 Tax=Streptomyces sp. NBC_00285 TaxID=2975700 RepID=UPI002E2B532D|nr:hypothetical protein [Streptomyces sp. NBC_00285]
MALHTHDHGLRTVRAARQLRRIRAFYAAGVVLWAATTAWTAWDSPGGRPMWTSVLLLVVFSSLLFMAGWWLRHLETADAPRPAHHVAPRRASGRHAVSGS